ncbi:DUF1501 domain-containing protein [Nannocystis sp. ILAH1]|uniref:DUF1501 domain-containing protein n=1 Tax=Nannocystis sp. ILAH1 TaxID=2996789 RepID=UPI00226F5E7B|nr:DUF1501 domain-containing protein [Nannocystis sp. ILAH1]MCY0988012.1 DUF1501 domain-containing protein [Nannocystis sp. ILAH1]
MSTSRRHFLVSTAAGLGALAVPKASFAAPAEQRFLLVVFARGAWDVTYCLDPKAPPGCDVPAGEVTTYPAGPRVLTSSERPSIRAFFDAHASRAAIVNGIWIGSVAHVPARVRILTGTRSERNPDVAAIFAAEAAGKQPALALPYVDLGGGAYAGPLASFMGRVGNTNQLVTLLNRAKAFRGAPKGKAQPGFEFTGEEQAALAKFVAGRADAARAGKTGPEAQVLEGFRTSLDRAEALRRDPQLRAMAVGTATSLAQQGELAVAMFRGGVAAAAFLDSRLDWDTHDAIADQGTAHEQLFAELGTIARKLDEAGLLARTTVAVLSEFTRTPKLNSQPEPGKDHWPLTSALVFGGGVRPGVYGATDEKLGAMRVRMDDGKPSDGGRLLQFDNFAAGLLEHLAVSSRRWIANAEPFRGPFA